jgi:hypothetical protein
MDRTWLTDPGRTGIAYEQTEFSGYPLMQTYLAGIRYIGDDPRLLLVASLRMPRPIIIYRSQWKRPRTLRRSATSLGM